jgi:hypothetical protein
MGIDVEDLIITAMSRKDPQEGIKLRLTLARKYMAEAEEYLKKTIRHRLPKRRIGSLRKWLKPYRRGSICRSINEPLRKGDGTLTL